MTKKFEGENSLKVQREQARKANQVLIVIIVLLSLALGFTLWQYFDLRKSLDQKGSEVELLGDERNQLQDELEEMLHGFDSLETDNDSMRVELANRRTEIEDLLAKAKDKDFAIYKLRKETTTLRTIMRGYVVTIDSLNTLNVGLRRQNEEVIQTLTAERDKSKQLQKTNENLSSKVALASQLEVSDVKVFGVRVRRDMTGRETDRARRTDKLRICFTLNENKVAPKEKKMLYLRIIAPDGAILTAKGDNAPQFEFNGNKGFYSDKKEVDYDGTAKSYCLDWEKPTEDFDLPSGKYHLSIYAEDYEMASFTYELK